MRQTHPRGRSEVDPSHSISKLSIPHKRGGAPTFHHFEIIPAYGQEGIHPGKLKTILEGLARLNRILLEMSCSTTFDSHIIYIIFLGLLSHTISNQ
jgi:hypothetical protein